MTIATLAPRPSGASARAAMMPPSRLETRIANVNAYDASPARTSCWENSARSGDRTSPSPPRRPRPRVADPAVGECAPLFGGQPLLHLPDAHAGAARLGPARAARRRLV